MTPKPEVEVIGAGLAGCEAALQLAAAGIAVILTDIKPDSFTPAHVNAHFCELVCSNSLKSDEPFTASGLLKAELRQLGCRLLSIAEATRVPAGGALAVDRGLFAAEVTRRIKSEPLIHTVCAEAGDFDAEKLTILATGPLTVGGLRDSIAGRLKGNLHFYDAASPIVSADSVDFDKTFAAGRYGRGGCDYINCPLSKDEYDALVEGLTGAGRAVLKSFEDGIFESCIPVEVMAARGRDTLRFGPLRPVGFIDPSIGRRPYAVVQLRRENAAGDMYNIVGFQTNLLFGEQKRVFGLIPALKNAEYLRYGVMHLNTYIDSPKALLPGFNCRKFPKTYVAGQLSGVEGYVESIASGLIAARNVVASLNGRGPFVPPAETMIGALIRYLATPNDCFQPMNANFGLLPPPAQSIRDKRERKLRLYQSALEALKNYQNGCIIGEAVI